MKTITWIFLASIISLNVSKAQENEVFPKLPFSLEKAVAQGHNQASIWIEFYQKTEDDESGYQWSTPDGDGYQLRAFDYTEGKIQTITDYFPSGDQSKQLIYYYQNGLCAAIDETYPSVRMEKDSIPFSYLFMYGRDTMPFQKVVKYNYEANFRLLYDYGFDHKKRMVRERVTTAGKMRNVDHLMTLKDNKQAQITLTEYRHDMEIVRVYQDLHTIITAHHTHIGEDGNPARTEIQNIDREVIQIIDYDYEGEQLIQTRFYDPRIEAEDGKLIKRIYHQWNDQGLLEKEIIEENDKQQILTYSYYNN